MKPSDENKKIAKKILQVFGGRPRVAKYWDDGHISHIDILSTINQPFEGISSYSTIGLSDYSIGYRAEDKPLRVEIIGAHATENNDFPNILATCAFNVMNAKQAISPGEVFQDIVALYYPDSEMKHILFTDPFLWANLESFELPEKTVAWLLAVPISINEYLYSVDKGIDALEDLFEQENIDIYDIERKSVL